MRIETLVAPTLTVGFEGIGPRLAIGPPTQGHTIIPHHSRSTKPFPQNGSLLDIGTEANLVAVLWVCYASEFCQNVEEEEGMYRLAGRHPSR